LVTDLPADFEVFGQAVATSMADLLGGTTGQVLAKASNTNMDFTWVAQDDSNAIQNAIVDAKGDLIAASAADTPARLAVGNNGETLVADSSTSTGLRYNPQNALVNSVINGGLDIWQRGTSFAASGSAKVYTADRWSFWRGGLVTGGTVSRQNTSDTTNLPNIQYCARVQRDSGNTSTQQLTLAQDFESVNSIPYAGKTVTVSFYARKGANYSVAASDVNIVLASGTGTDQQIINGYTGQVTVASGFQTVTTTWQRFVITGTIPTNSTQIGITANSGAPVGTAGAADYFEVTGIQIDLGTYTASTAPTFRRTGGTIQGELAACQRYYQQYAGGLGVPYNAVATTATTLMTYLAIQPTMRTAATCTVGGTLYADDGYAGTVNAASPTVDFVDQYQGGGRFRIGGFSGMTTGRQYSFYYNTGYIGLSAEL